MLAAAVTLLAALQLSTPPQLQLHTLTSRVFGNTRQLRVLLPADYDAPENRDRTYPVLYLNDGQNLFDSATAIFNPMEWQVDETVERLSAAGRIPPLIVVGIDNAGRRGRAHEYLPWPDRYLQPPDTNPAGRRFPEFLLDEVLPWVQAHYRVRRSPADMTLGGSSYGALIALYTALARPGVFGGLLLESPSFYVDDRHLLRDAAKSTSWPGRIYLGVGTNEGGRPHCDPAGLTDPEAVEDVQALADILRRSAGPPALEVVIEPCGTHDEAAWARRLPGALEFLLGPGR